MNIEESFFWLANQTITAVIPSTFDPLKNISVLSNGNLTADVGAYTFLTGGNTTHSSGKYYAEIKADGQSGAVYYCIGVTNINPWNNSISPLGAAGNIMYAAFGFVYKPGDGGSPKTGHSTYTTGDNIGIALDLDNGFIYFAKNGTWINSGVPTSGSSGTGALYSGLSGVYYLAVGAGSGAGYHIFTLNAGAIGFSYSIPSGYSPW
jgi:hypothetical protein